MAWTVSAFKNSGSNQTDSQIAKLLKPKLLKRGMFKNGIIRDLCGLPVILGRAGSLEVRLAITKKDIRRAQRLRYKVFYEEMSATPNPTAYLTRRDKDPFDRICDHLLVLDYDVPTKPFRTSKPKIVGTYRLLRQDVASRNFGFYSNGEFDLSSLVEANSDSKFLELGRSCVLKDYRSKRTLDLLWQGVYAYMTHHKIDFMVGCASFEGTSVSDHGYALSFLHHYASGSNIRPTAIAGRRIDMNMIPKDEIDAKKALRTLPPLIKGYLRLGATFGDGAVVDTQFGTIDVLVIMKVADIDPRYMSHYKAVAQNIVTSTIGDNL
jgi:L-ornithine Nalpha-acyltransferase